jgi:hypothetical protein
MITFDPLRSQPVPPGTITLQQEAAVGSWWADAVQGPALMDSCKLSRQGPLGHPIWVSIADLTLTEFNTYRIAWLPDRVQWFVNGQLVREETGIVPTEDLALHLNP